MSTSPSEQLGPLSDRLAQELISQFAPNGAVVELVESQALIARREAGTIGTTLEVDPVSNVHQSVFRSSLP